MTMSHFVVPLFAIALLTGCDGRPAEPATTDAPLHGETHTLAVGETVTVVGTGLAIRFDDVSHDSRCATDVVCVWEGDAVVDVVVTHAGREHRLHLHTSPGTATGPAHADVAGYRITLDRLAPQPRSNHPIPRSEYRATLRIEEEP